MVQSHNRRMTLSWYLASIAVVDTVELAIGKFLCKVIAATFAFFFLKNRLKLNICWFVESQLSEPFEVAEVMGNVLAVYNN